jgi:acetyl-CoA carboxylase carboxyltransferase component
MAWPTAEMSFVDPEVAANVVFAGKAEASEELRKKWRELVQEMVKDASPYGAAGVHCLHDVIEPVATRDYILRALEICQNHRGGLSEHRLANWRRNSVERLCAAGN